MITSYCSHCGLHTHIHYTTDPLSSSCSRILTASSCCSTWRATDEDALTYMAGAAPLLFLPVTIKLQLVHQSSYIKSTDKAITLTVQQIL